MRALKKNMQKMWYSLQEEVQSGYETDDDGNVVYVEIDGELVPVENGDKEPGYSAPAIFYANIHGTIGEADAARFGVSLGEYDAYIYAPKGSLPFTETTLIWYHNAPIFKDEEETKVDPDSADYIVTRIPVVLDESVYLLKRREHE